MSRDTAVTTEKENFKRTILINIVGKRDEWKMIWRTYLLNLEIPIAF